ncbi:hypothetical protein [Amycolatopsis sp. cg13]|uniref:hypothetical protein n=1 Tax=Amycolatopsis sp. cg13 TaxID=3238807 RepID=UPI003526789C
MATSRSARSTIRRIAAVCGAVALTAVGGATTAGASTPELAASCSLPGPPGGARPCDQHYADIRWQCYPEQSELCYRTIYAVGTDYRIYYAESGIDGWGGWHEEGRGGRASRAGGGIFFYAEGGNSHGPTHGHLRVYGTTGKYYCEDIRKNSWGSEVTRPWYLCPQQ